MAALLSVSDSIPMKRKLFLPVILLCLGFTAVVDSSTSANSAPSSTSGPDTPWQRASATASALQSIWFNPSCSPFCWTNGSFWTDANALETLMNLKAVSELQNLTTSSLMMSNSTNWTQALGPVVESIYTTQDVTHLTVSPTFYDDALWWGLAWLRSFEEYDDQRYLERSLQILETVYADAWDPASCNGGLWWSNDRTYKNAITNELFAALSARLAVQTGNETIIGWAKQTFEWFLQSGMLNKQTSLVNDGLNDTCQNNGQQTWTYNQGVILSACASLYQLTNDMTYLTRFANATIVATLTHLVYIDNGVLMDPCDMLIGGCDNDASQFKGVFARHLFYFTKVLENTTNTSTWWRQNITKMANILWEKARNDTLELGGNWEGPFNGATPIRQASALDLLVFATDEFSR